MKFRTAIAAVALIGVTLAGGIAATASVDTGAARQAAEAAKDAGKALSKRKADKAVAAAERAVALAPRDAGYRTLLGQAYLAAGRFTSAAAALKDALTLDPANGTAALHLALAQVATGDWGGARATLNAHDDRIAPADRGLALALAGDPVAAVELLTAAARAPDADAKTRQNLALSLALAGRWHDARTVAAYDVSPADLDKRIMQWASFARPTSASDQVAALLGVTPIEDAGQPQRLALDMTTTAVAAVAQAVNPVDAFMPGPAGNVPAADAAAAEAPTPQIAAEPMPGEEPAPAAVADVAPAPAVGSGVVFAPRQEIVQAVPSRAARSVRVARPVKAAVAPVAVAAVPAARSYARGKFYVQLGAFENAAVARDSWGRMSRRNATLAGLTPAGVSVKQGRGSFYRLSVGGFSRGEAVALCGKVRAHGGKCFVRVSTGDAVASWVKGGGGVALAAR